MLRVVAIVVLTALGVQRAHAAPCVDPAAVAAVRAAAEARCPCAAATNHGQYVKCVAGVAKAAVAGGELPKSCKGAVVACAARSTCGKPAGSVTCCRTNAKGVTRCAIKASASKCKAPKGGGACVGTAPSCCEACSQGSCPLPTTTTTTVPGSTTTTTMPGARTHTVMVGDGGLTFSPANLTIHAGDTVHWVWAGCCHNVVSGMDGTSDGRFCSPNDTGCATAPLSGAGTTYDHTFPTTGTFPYYCSAHFALGMTGTITVQ